MEKLTPPVISPKKVDEADVTVRVTGTVMEGLPVVAVMMTSPVYVPAANPAALIAIGMV